jgi:glycerol kinase
MFPILAIDQGTTSTKACRMDAAGGISVVGHRTHRQIRLHEGWVEHDPLELLGNIRILLAQAGRVGSIGLANQGETVVAWDARSKRPLANAIVWQDGRTGAEVEHLRAAGVEAVTLARAGLPLDPYFSATKLRWLLDHAEGAQALRREGRLRLGTSDAFFIDALTGEFATDVSTASRTSLMDLRALQWDPQLCEIFGVPMECLPEIRSTAGGFGNLAGGGAALVASAVDQQAALAGHGCENRGDVKITFGTGAFALGLTGTAPVMAEGSGLLPTVAWRIGQAPAQYALDGGILTAGSALEWLREIGLLDDFAALDVLREPSAASRDLFFVPAQTGLGCPYWDRRARGAWLGLGLDTPRIALVQAVFEGIALRAVQLVDAFAQSSGVGRVSIDGGLSRSAYFTRFLANALGREIHVAEDADLTMIGLLKLCAAAGGVQIRVMQEWRRVAPEGIAFGGIKRRFADAVSRTLGWKEG